MKRLVILTLIIIYAGINLFGQTDGISYQAVIIDPNGQELPGVDAEGNILPNAEISVRFTIIDANNQEVYQEVQVTHTDAYGMINLIIGQADPDAFSLIDWDGTQKDLKVEIDFGGANSGYSEMSRQSMTFVPYAYHRNIYAHGSLEVDDAALLNSQLTVQGPANLNSSLDVNNGNTTTLTGELQVDGRANLNNDLNVEGTTNLNDSLNVYNLSPTYLSGDLTVGADGTSTFNGTTVFNAPSEFVQIGVNGPSDLRGQVTVSANLDTVGGQDNYNAYPMLIQGSSQGLAIKVEGSRSISNNYVSFWDEESGNMWGRIEGITLDELKDDPEQKWEHGFKISGIVTSSADLVIAYADYAQSAVDFAADLTSSTACAGVGACVTAPIPSFIAAGGIGLISSAANVVLSAANLGISIADEATYVKFRNDNIGVSYQSGAGDYAEWLPKENSSEEFAGGELVGVNNGNVTKNIWGAEKVMIVSTNPIVLGNMPGSGDESNYVKIAFMGQVPVRVLGPVEPGDYILPNELADGFGKGVHPEEMETGDYDMIAGVTWSVLEKIGELNIVNVAVGINTNDLNRVVHQQEEELQTIRSEYNELKSQMERSNAVLADLVPGYADATGFKTDTIPSVPGQTREYYDQVTAKNDVVQSTDDDIIYFEVTREQIETFIEIARNNYINLLEETQHNRSILLDGELNNTKSQQANILVPIEEHPFWQKMDNNPEYREKIILEVQSRLEKAMHTHKKYIQNFTGLKVLE